MYNWLINNYIEFFGVVFGILYVFLEIRQDYRLWPVGIFTSAIYIWVFFDNKLYADMALQCYYLVVSVLGWYWWRRSRDSEGVEDESSKGSESTSQELTVSSIKMKMAIPLSLIFLLLYLTMCYVLDTYTDSPVPYGDAFITSLSAVATWMLARKIIEHWYLWIVVNLFAALLFFSRGLYPTVILYVVYCAMSFVGLREWKKQL